MIACSRDGMVAGTWAMRGMSALRSTKHMTDGLSMSRFYLTGRTPSPFPAEPEQLHKIMRRAAKIKDNEIYTDADRCTALMRNLSTEIQMEFSPKDSK
jgi:hypothetical protein